MHWRRNLRLVRIEGSSNFLQGVLQCYISCKKKIKSCKEATHFPTNPSCKILASFLQNYWHLLASYLPRYTQKFCKILASFLQNYWHLLASYLPRYTEILQNPCKLLAKLLASSCKLSSKIQKNLVRMLCQVLAFTHARFLQDLDFYLLASLTLQDSSKNLHTYLARMCKKRDIFLALCKVHARFHFILQEFLQEVLCKILQELSVWEVS